MVWASTGFVLRDLDSLAGKVDQLNGAVGNFQQRMTLLDRRLSEDAIGASSETVPDVEAVQVLLDDMVARGTLAQARASAIRANL